MKILPTYWAIVLRIGHTAYIVFCITAMSNRVHLRVQATSKQIRDEFITANQEIARQFELIDRLAAYARDRRKSDDILFNMYSLVLFACAMWSMFT